MSPSQSPFDVVAQAARDGRIDDARRELACLQAAWPAEPDSADRRRLQEWRWWLDPMWWQPLRAGDVVLRRTRADDADFYRAAMIEGDFARRYNRQPPWRGELSDSLARSGVLAARELGAVYWIVCNAAGVRHGLASLSNLSLGNAKAEFSIGFPSDPQPLQAVTATLLIFHFAFFTLRLNKLCAHVYAGNTAALHNARRVGLREEGLLKDHFWLPPGEFVDVHTLGVTRAQLLGDERVCRMAQRRLGFTWRACSA